MRYIKEMEGIPVGGVNINNLRYADDTALLADGEQKLQELVNVVVEQSARKGLEISRMKSLCDGVLEEPDQSNLQDKG